MDTTNIHPPGPFTETMGRLAYAFAQVQPYLPMYTHLILSALFPIVTGAFSSLSRPSSAAKPTKAKRKKTTTSDDESDSEDGEVSMLDGAADAEQDPGLVLQQYGCVQCCEARQRRAGTYRGVRVAEILRRPWSGMAGQGRRTEDRRCHRSGLIYGRTKRQTITLPWYPGSHTPPNPSLNHPLDSPPTPPPNLPHPRPLAPHPAFPPPPHHPHPPLLPHRPQHRPLRHLRLDPLVPHQPPRFRLLLQRAATDVAHLLHHRQYDPHRAVLLRHLLCLLHAHDGVSGVEVGRADQAAVPATGGGGPGGCGQEVGDAGAGRCCAAGHCDRVGAALRSFHVLQENAADEHQPQPHCRGRDRQRQQHSTVRDQSPNPSRDKSALPPRDRPLGQPLLDDLLAAPLPTPSSVVLAPRSPDHAPAP
ncbi:hypothetical protein M8818_002969 [Zalaria obscura]|uniref:Uncharacterized protein n=1 Tax=Zalaria obscura TaxID=2024903 RepID=A0ACC3SK10_9PEZI